MLAITISAFWLMTQLSGVSVAQSTGIITTVAGNGTAGFAGDSGPAIAAQIGHATGIAVDFAGNLYIADKENHRVRKVTRDGMISTVAGNGTAGYSGVGGLALGTPDSTLRPQWRGSRPGHPTSPSWRLANALSAMLPSAPPRGLRAASPSNPAPRSGSSQFREARV